MPLKECALSLSLSLYSHSHFANIRDGLYKQGWPASHAHNVIIFVCTTQLLLLDIFFVVLTLLTLVVLMPLCTHRQRCGHQKNKLFHLSQECVDITCNSVYVVVMGSDISLLSPHCHVS